MTFKNLLYYSLLIFVTIWLGSCDDEHDDDFIRLDKTSLTIDAKGGGEVISIESSGVWELQNLPVWIVTNPGLHDGPDSQIYLSVSENPEFERRNASLLFVCGDARKTFIVEQLGLKDLDPFVKLSENELSMSVFGDDEKVQLTSNTKWKVADLPDWVSVTPSEGDKSAEITIKVLENRNPSGRHINLVFTGGKVDKKLSVTQSGRKDINQSPLLSIFPYKQIKFPSTMDYVELETSALFVNPGIRDHIYLGNLICPKNENELGMNIPVFTGYTFNPITISTSANIGGDVAKTLTTPSLTGQDAFAREIIAKNPSSGSLKNGYEMEFYNHRFLHIVGVLNLGVKLDELVSGFSHKEKEMTKKYGMIYSFKKTFFTLDIDNPKDKLIKEELSQADKTKGVSYVSTMVYGRIGLLITESNTDSRDLKLAINKVIEDKSLTTAETGLIDAADIYYVYFDNNNRVQMKKGKMDAVQAYKDAMKKESDNIYPVGFYINDYMENAPGRFFISLKFDK